MKSLNLFAKGPHSMDQKWPRQGLFLLLTLLAASAGATTPKHPNAPANEENDLFFRMPQGEIVGTGVKRPDAEQWAWGEQQMIKANQVRLNPLGLARVNAARAARGQHPLEQTDANVAAIGTETQTSTGQTSLVP